MLEKKHLDILRERIPNFDIDRLNLQILRMFYKQEISSSLWNNHRIHLYLQDVFETDISCDIIAFLTSSSRNIKFQLPMIDLEWISYGDDIEDCLNKLLKMLACYLLGGGEL